MARIKRIFIMTNVASKHSTEVHPELRADWSNDRHQAIPMNSLEAKDVAMALKELGSLVNAEIVNDKL